MKVVSAIEIAENYFDLSNQRNLEEIEMLLTENSTYSSPNTGVFVGVDQIMKMKHEFYGGFKKMQWLVNSVEELRPGVIEFDFIFSGTTLDDEEVTRPGTEYVIIKDEKLLHIEVRNK